MITSSTQPSVADSADMSGAFEFLDRLALNNNRPWFQQHKAEYDAVRSHWLAQLQRIINAMARWDESLAALTPKVASYRIYRDTRFSSDKTPYKVFLSASFSPYGRKPHMGGYYLQVDTRPGEIGLYGGVWCPEPKVLNKLRHAIVDNFEEFDHILSDPALGKLYPGWCSSATLKTIPKGWDKNHPQAEILRLKDYGKFHPVDRQFFSDPFWPEKTAELFRPLKPLIDFLNYSIEEDVEPVELR